MNDELPERLRRSAAALYLSRRYGIGSASYLMKLASQGTGPKFQKIGHMCLYRPEDLDDWAQNRVDGRSLRYERERAAAAAAAEAAAVTCNAGGGDEH